MYIVKGENTAVQKQVEAAAKTERIVSENSTNSLGVVFPISHPSSD